MYYCFGCQKGGDSFKFIMEIENLEFFDAVKFLAKKAGVNINLKHDKNYNKDRESLLELYRRLNKTFEYLLINSKEAEKYLKYLYSRGFDEDIINLFNLGFAPHNKNWLYEFLIKKGYSDNILKKSGLFSYKTNNPYPYFSGRITFPIKNIHGDIIAFGGRELENRGPKYLNSPETSIFKKKDNLFGINNAIPHIKESKSFIIVEGYMDVLALNQADIHNCVAPLGTALHENQIKLLKRYAPNCILLLDSDEAGIKATIRSINICEKTGVNTEIICLENEKDPADILKKDGKDALQKVLKYPINNFQFLINYALKKYNSKIPSEKQKIFSFFLPFFESIESEIKRDSYFTILAENINVDKESISRDFYKKEKKHYKNTEKGGKRKKHLTLEEYLLIAVIANHEYFTIVRNNLQLEDFKEPDAKKIFIALEECFRDDIFSIDSIFKYIEDDSLKNLILEKISSNEFLLNKDKIIQDAVNKIKTRNLTLRREEITILLQKNKSEPWKINDLLVEKMILDKEIEELKVKNNE